MNSLTSHPFSLRLFSGALLLILLTGCSQDSGEQTEASDENPSQMTRISIEDWDFQLGEYPPNILVVDYWATWCTPCIERFPRMVEMSREYADQGVTFVSFNLDEPEDDFSQARAEDFLMAMEAGFEHFATSSNVFDAMEYFNLESIPAVSIYDRTGVEATRLVGDMYSGEVFDDADVESAILALLEEEPLPR